MEQQQVTEETGLKEESSPAVEEKKPSFEDYAAYEYQNLLPKFRDKLAELSAKQLKKVMQAIMEYPLEKVDFHWSYEKEKELFIIGTKLMDCRFVIIKAALDLKKEEIEELLKPQTQEETVLVDRTNV